MRVLCFSPVSSFKGGAEHSLFDLLANPDADFVVAVPEEGPVAARARSLGYGVEVIALGAVSRIRRPLRLRHAFPVLGDLYLAARSLKHIARVRKIDVVHTNGLKAHFIGILSRRLGSPPIVVHIRDIANTRLEVAAFKVLAGMADQVVLVSRACWPFRGSLPPHVSIVHNGTVAPSKVLALPESQTITLGLCGRIHPAKGHDLLFEWMAAAKARGYRLRLSVRGQADAEGAAFLRQLHRLAQARGLGNDVHFDGVRAGSAIYEGLNLVVVPSRIPDPLPRSVMEAMSFGIPVAGYPLGGIPEMIEHRQTGWLVADEHQFVACLEDLADTTLVSRIVDAARARVAQEFSMQRLHASVTRIYNAACGHHVAG